MKEQIKGYNYDSLHAQGPGRRFDTDYGFVRGKSVTKGEDGPLITSYNGYNCYLSPTNIAATYGSSYLQIRPPPLLP